MYCLQNSQIHHEVRKREGGDNLRRKKVVTGDESNVLEESLRLYHQSADPQLILRVIGAIDKTIGYYERNYALLNFDGIFGAKVVEGQLNLVVAEYSKGFLSDIMDDSMKNDVVKIAARAGHIVKQAMPHLYVKYPGQMRQMRRLFYLSWDIGHSHRLVDLGLTWSDDLHLQAQALTFNEEESNQCLAELLEPVDGMMCRMSEYCQRVMTKPGMEKYILCHQILYSVVAEMSGCGSRLEKWLVKHKRSGSLEQLQEEMCSNLYSEALALAATTFSDDVPTFRDLTVEMEFVCGMLGYVEFLRRDWLLGIFKWQSDSGCFPSSKQPIGRKLLMEERLPDGCLSHLTTVAVSALAVHLHYLLNPSRINMVKKKVPPPVVDPARVLQPPPPEVNLLYSPTGELFNHPLFREDFQDGAFKAVVPDKSLEDKADIVMRLLSERTSASKVIRKNSSVSDEFGTSKINHMPPNQSSPFAQYLVSTKMVGTPKEYSASTFYFIIASIILVIIGIIRYNHNKRRNPLVFRGKLRFL